MATVGNPPSVDYIVAVDGGTGDVTGFAPWAKDLPAAVIEFHHCAALAMVDERAAGDCYWMLVALWASSTLASVYPGVAQAGGGTGVGPGSGSVVTSQKVGDVSYTFSSNTASVDGLTGIAAAYRKMYHDTLKSCGLTVGLRYIC